MEIFLEYHTILYSTHEESPQKCPYDFRMIFSTMRILRSPVQIKKYKILIIYFVIPTLKRKEFN